MEMSNLKPFWSGLILTAMYMIGSIVYTAVFLDFGIELIYSILFSLLLICCFLNMRKAYRFAVIACFGEILYYIICMIRNDPAWWYFIAIVAMILFICARFSGKDLILIPGILGLLPVLYTALYRVFMSIYRYDYDLVLVFSNDGSIVVHELLVFVKYFIIIFACCKLICGKYKQKLRKVNTFVGNAVVTEDTLETLKEKYDAGELSAEEYAAKKAEIMQKL